MARYINTPKTSLKGINAELVKVQDAFEDVLDRRGDGANFLDTDLDMNSQRILNLPEPVHPQEPVRLGDVKAFIDDTKTARDAAVRAAGDTINAKDTSIVQANIATDKANESLQSANEALQSANEALQSANESANKAAIATTQANLAISSASSAATSESNALSSANLADSRASDSESAASDAEASANIATAAADGAEASANIATAAAADTLGANAIEQASGGKNKIFVDAQGNQNVMVWINKFNSEDVNQAILERHGVDLQLGTGVFPAFIKNGVQMRGFWYAKYIASAGENGGCSVISGVQPRTSFNYDTAKALCTAKGAGWHLSANIEWLAVAYLGLAFGEQPRGDTNYGRAHDAKHEVATRASATHAPSDTGHYSSSYTGTGPATWSHDGTQFGVFDMVGNVWEWQDQLKLQEGQIFAPIDNNPDMLEGDWPAHECYFDSSGESGGSVILNSLITNRTGDLGDNGDGNGSNSTTWRTMAKDPSYVENLLMRQMGIEPPPDAILNGNLYSRNFGERLPFRGGAWYYTYFAGLGALYFDSSRTVVNSAIGFRPALFES